MQSIITQPRLTHREANTNSSSRKVKMGNISERRKHPRFKVKGGLTAILLPGRGRSGEIKNVSRTGIAFSYITSGNWTVETAAIDIVSQDGGCRLEEIPCKSIHESSDKNKDSSSLMEWRTHGLEFGAMNLEQKEMLNNLIRDYATS